MTRRRARDPVARRALTTGLVLTVVAVAFEGLAVPTIMPTVARELGGLEFYGWAFSAFMITNVVGIVAAGEQADRGGMRGAFVAGLVLFGLGLVAAACVPSMRLLVGARAIQGLGGGALSTVVYACVAQAYAPDERPRMLAVMSTAWVVPGLVGPGLSGLVTDWIGWRAVFVGLTPLLLITAMLVLPALRDVPRGAPSTPAHSLVPSALAVAIGMTMVLIGIERPSFAQRMVVVLAGVVPSVLGLRRLLPAGTLAVRAGLPAAVVVMGLVCFAFFGAEAVVPLLVTVRFHASATIAGLALSAATLAWTIGAWAQARLAATSNRAVLVATGTGLIGLGIVGVTLAVRESAPLALVWGGWAVAGLGMGLAHATISLVVLEEAPDGGVGAASAAMQITSAIGVALGTGATGTLMSMSASQTRGLVLGFLTTTGAAAAALVVAARLPGRRR